MKKQCLESIIRGLNEAGVRYLIAGGLAVVAHGYVRFTADVDLILDLRTENVRKAAAALTALGFRPRAPVPMEAFADEAVRKQWITDKNLTVFSLFSPAHPGTEIDLFVESPLAFDEAYARKARLNLSGTTEGTFVGYRDLIAMKLKAGRQQDIEDVQRLRALRGESES